MDDPNKTPPPEQGQSVQPQQQTSPPPFQPPAPPPPQAQPTQPYQPPYVYPPYQSQAPAPGAPYPASGGVPPAPPQYQYPYSQYPNGQYPYAQPAQPEPTEHRSNTAQAILLPIGLGVLGLVITAVAFIAGGPFATFMGVGLQIAPFAILAALAYGGVKNNVAAAFAYVWLALLVFLIILADLLFTLAPFLQGGAALKPGAGQAVLSAMGLLAIVSIVSAAMLARPVRVAVSRIMPIDPDNFVHRIALCILTFTLFSSFVPLIVLGGTPPFLALLSNDAISGAGGTGGPGIGGSGGSGIGGTGGSGTAVGPLDAFYQLLWTIPAVLVAAGWPIARRFRETLMRLGLIRPTWKQIAIGLGFGVVFAFASTYLDQVIHDLWVALGWTTTDTESLNKLLGDLVSPVGAVVVGVAAGVGEEMAVRGLLQPRIGLIASNLVFTSLHAYQYSFDALLSVFIVGLVFGIIRSRTNTTTSAIAHGVYDFVVLLALYFAGQAT